MKNKSNIPKRGFASTKVSNEQKNRHKRNSVASTEFRKRHPTVDIPSDYSINLHTMQPTEISHRSKRVAASVELEHRPKMNGIPYVQYRPDEWK